MESWNLTKLVFDTRHELESFGWKTPKPSDCLLYALSEVGEASDAYLRSIRPDDLRREERVVSLSEEIADAVIMVVSAFPKQEIYLEDCLFSVPIKDTFYALGMLANSIGTLILSYPYYSYPTIRTMLSLCSELLSSPDALWRAVEQKLQKIRQRVLERGA